MITSAGLSVNALRTYLRYAAENSLTVCEARQSAIRGIRVRSVLSCQTIRTARSAMRLMSSRRLRGFTPKTRFLRALWGSHIVCPSVRTHSSRGFASQMGHTNSRACSFTVMPQVYSDRSGIQAPLKPPNVTPVRAVLTSTSTSTLHARAYSLERNRVSSSPLRIF